MPSSDRFDRAVDPCIVKFRLQNPVALQEVEAAIKEVLLEMQIGEEQAEVTGQPASKAFTLRFKGAANLAAARASKFSQFQQTGNKWRELSAASLDGTKHRIFVDLDKHGKQIRTEIVARKLCRALKVKYSDTEFFTKGS